MIGFSTCWCKQRVECGPHVSCKGVNGNTYLKLSEKRAVLVYYLHLLTWSMLTIKAHVHHFQNRMVLCYDIKLVHFKILFQLINFSRTEAGRFFETFSACRESFDEQGRCVRPVHAGDGTNDVAKFRKATLFFIFAWICVFAFLSDKINAVEK